MLYNNPSLWKEEKICGNVEFPGSRALDSPVTVFDYTFIFITCTPSDDDDFCLLYPYSV